MIFALTLWNREVKSLGNEDQKVNNSQYENRGAREGGEGGSLWRKL